MDKPNAAPGTSHATKQPTKPKATKKTATASDQDDVTSTKDKAAESKPKKTPTSVLNLVCEAIEVVGEKRKGASVQAIKKYITSKTEKDTTRQNKLVNTALLKGFEQGILIRPAASANAKGATGYVALAKKEAKPKKVKADAKQHDIEDYVSDSETMTKPAKPRKRVLSDSIAPDGFKEASTPRRPVKKKIAETTSKIENKTATSETSAETDKESQKKTKAGKPKTEKSSQDKAPKTVKSSQDKATKNEKPSNEKAPKTVKPSQDKAPKNEKPSHDKAPKNEKPSQDKASKKEKPSQEKPPKTVKSSQKAPKTKS